MIKVFGQTDKTFSSNGDVVLRPVRAIVHKEDNGSFYLDLETDLSYLEWLKEGNIIVAPTPQGEQAFRLTNPTVTRKKIRSQCKHVFYDAANYLIEDSYVVGKDCNDALDHLNSATEPQSEFTTLSDVSTVNSFRCVRKTLLEAVQTVLERWGGHLVRDNFQIAIKHEIGLDNGVVVRYGSNLKDISCEYNWDNVVTKLLPTGRDGIMLPEKYVESEQQYEIPYTKTVEFSQDLNEDDYASHDAYLAALVSDLRTKAQNYVEEHSVPEVNYTLDANLEKITDIGDTVEVIDSRLGLRLTTHVIAYDYDCILGKYKSLQFGNFRQTIENLMSTITEAAETVATEKTEAVKVVLGAELTAATSQIWAALSDSYVIYDGDKILVVDSLPKESATNVIMINSGGIGFSQTGINGTFNSAWSIDGTLNMQNINVINLVADLIKGGTLKLGSRLNESGVIELYDEYNVLIGLMNKDGLKMFGQDGSYVLMNQSVGFAGYDRLNNKIYWVSQDEFHMKKSVVEEEITLCNQLRFIPIQIKNGNNEIVNEGIGLVSSVSGNG